MNRLERGGDSVEKVFCPGWVKAVRDAHNQLREINSQSHLLSLVRFGRDDSVEYIEMPRDTIRSYGAGNRAVALQGYLGELNRTLRNYVDGLPVQEQFGFE